MEYLNTLLNKKVGAETIIIKKGIKLNPDCQIPLYTIETHKGRSIAYVYSDMELVNRFSSQIRDWRIPISLEIKFEADPGLSFYNCPINALKSIVSTYNQVIAPYNIPIGKINPFLERPQRRLTEEMADRLIKMKEGMEPIIVCS